MSEHSFPSESSGFVDVDPIFDMGSSRHPDLQESGPDGDVKPGRSEPPVERTIQAPEAVVLVERVEIDSFLPLLLCLPPTALVLDDNAYYIYGAIEAEDWKRASDYAERSLFGMTWTKASLVSLSTPSCGWLSSNLQTKRSSHLLNDCESLNRIHPYPTSPCLSPSITALEIASLPDTSSLSFRSFLTALLAGAQYVSELTLGPGRLPDSLLQTFFLFKHIRHLELKDVIEFFDFNFVEQVGGLVKLETLILDTRNSQYKCRVQPLPPPQSWAVPPLESEQTIGSPDDHTTTCRAFQGPSSADVTSISGFPELSNISVVGSLMLIGDLVHYIRTTKLNEASLTFVPSSSSMPTDWWMVKKQSSANPQASSRLKPTSVTSAVYCTCKCQACRMTKKRSTKVAAPSVTVPPSPPPTSSEIIATIIECLVSLGQESLQRVSLEQVRGASAFSYPIFPSLAFETLVQRPTLVNLEMTGWDIEAVDSALRVLPKMSNLQFLSLPISNLNVGISLPTLRDIAECCPSLTYFQCRVSNFLNEPAEFDRSITDPLSHRLRVLSLGSSAPLDQDRLKVAQYLYSLFPVLDDLKTHNSFNPEQWEYVLTLLKMYQSNRAVDARRVIL